MQPRKYSKKNFKTELQKKPNTTSKVLEATKSSGLVKPGTTGLCT
jgi:hypothetical protein